MSGFGGVSYFGYASAPWAKKRDENKKKCLTNQKNKYKFAKRNLGGNLN